MFEEIVDLQIFSEKLLGKELIVTAFVTVRRGEGDILIEGRFTPPVEDHQLDKMTVMMLEMMGIKVEPKALLQYSANQERENEYGLYM